jgi:putative endonuclease
MADKTKKKEIGNKGENIACIFLESKYYKIVEKNFRAAKCEIDIIAQKDEYIIFIEVKTRSTQKFGNASQSVGIEKQKNIIKTAEIFLASSELYIDMQPRFDVIEIYIDVKTGKNYINHIEFAFIT